MSVPYVAAKVGGTPSLEEALSDRDRAAVVIEIGARLTKCALAGEHAPRHVYRTPAAVARLRCAKDVSKAADSAPAADDVVAGALQDFFHDLFFVRLLVNPRERKVVISEDLLFPHLFKRLVLRALFERFEVPVVVFVPSYVATLFAVSADSALIVDLGYEDSTVVPVYSGFPVAKAWEVAGVGARAVYSALRELLSSAPEQSLDVLSLLKSEEAVEGVFVQTGFVASSRDCAARVEGCAYPLKNGKSFIVPASARWSAAETLFGANDDGFCVAHAIAESLLRCPLDVRSTLAGRIVLVGGGAAWPGVSVRVRSELARVFEREERYASLKSLVPRVRVHKSLLPANTVSIVGASMIASLDVHLSDWISRAEFAKSEGLVPSNNKTIFIV